MYRPFVNGALHPAAPVRTNPEMLTNASAWVEGLLSVAGCSCAEQEAGTFSAAPFVLRDVRRAFFGFTDAALQGAPTPGLGGWFHGFFFSFALPFDMLGYPIVQLEFLGIILGHMVFAPLLRVGRGILVTDSETSWKIIANDGAHTDETQWIHDQFVSTCGNGTSFSKVVHGYGETNPYADLASRGRLRELFALARQMGITATRLDIPTAFIDLLAAFKARFGPRPAAPGALRQRHRQDTTAWALPPPHKPPVPAASAPSDVSEWIAPEPAPLPSPARTASAREIERRQHRGAAFLQGEFLPIQFPNPVLGEPDSSPSIPPTATLPAAPVLTLRHKAAPRVPAALRGALSPPPYALMPAAARQPPVSMRAQPTDPFSVPSTAGSHGASRVPFQATATQLPVLSAAGPHHPGCMPIQAPAKQLPFSLGRPCTGGSSSAQGLGLGRVPFQAQQLPGSLGSTAGQHHLGSVPVQASTQQLPVSLGMPFTGGSSNAQGLGLGRVPFQTQQLPGSLGSTAGPRNLGSAPTPDSSTQLSSHFESAAKSRGLGRVPFQPQQPSGHLESAVGSICLDRVPIQAAAQLPSGSSEAPSRDPPSVRFHKASAHAYCPPLAASERTRIRRIRHVLGPGPEAAKSQLAFEPGAGPLASVFQAVSVTLLAGVPDNTLDKDDLAWERWVLFCAMVGSHGTSPWRTNHAANSGSDALGFKQESDLLCGFLLYCYDIIKPRSKHDPAPQPQSAFNMVAAIRRIHRRHNIEMVSCSQLSAVLKGMTVNHMREHGSESLLPDRKQPFSPRFVRTLLATSDHEGIKLGQKKLDWASPLFLSFGAMCAVAMSTGFRKAEVALPAGDVFDDRRLRRASLVWRINGVLTADPTPAQLRGLVVGRDVAILRPPRCKNDFDGTSFGNKPIYLPFDPSDTINAATWLQRLELAFPCHGDARRSRALFFSEAKSFTPMSHSLVDTYLNHLLLLHLDPTEARRFSFHSFRIGFATALLAAGCSYDTIQALARWRSTESILIYARMDETAYCDFVTSALQQHTTSVTGRALPFAIDNDTLMATFLNAEARLAA